MTTTTPSHTRPFAPPTLREISLIRARAETAARALFAELGCLEVATPSLVACPGMEPNLRAFAIAPAEALELRGRYLHTSPELAIKSTLGALDLDVFTLCRCYRDEPPTELHHPEFTMLEWYRRDVEYTALMDDVEELVRRVAAAAVDASRSSQPHGALELEDGRLLDLRQPFARVSVADAFLTHVGVAPDADAQTLAAAAAGLGIDADVRWGWEALFSLLYSELVEPGIGRRGPTFLIEFPAATAALARLKPGDTSVAERFELILPWHDTGMEVANAFGELIDPAMQRRRFEHDLSVRAANGSALYPMPEAALTGLGGMRPTSGIALGWERLLTWATWVTRGWRLPVSAWLLAEPSKTR